MSALKKLDRMRLQKKHYQRLFDKDSYTLLCKEDLWLFVQEKNHCFYKNIIDEQSVILNNNTVNQIEFIKKSNVSNIRNQQTYRKKYLLCETILIIFNLYYKSFSRSFIFKDKENFNPHILFERIGKNWKSVKWILQADFQNCQGLLQNFTNLRKYSV